MVEKKIEKKNTIERNMCGVWKWSASAALTTFFQYVCIGKQFFPSTVTYLVFSAFSTHKWQNDEYYKWLAIDVFLWKLVKNAPNQFERSLLACKMLAPIHPFYRESIDSNSPQLWLLLGVAVFAVPAYIGSLVDTETEIAMR